MVEVHLIDESTKKKGQPAHSQPAGHMHAPLTVAEVDHVFVGLISSIGYAPAQHDKILRSFSLERKIKAIVSLQKEAERLRHLGFYAAQLQSGCSVVAILFLSALLKGPENAGADRPTKLYREFAAAGGVPLCARLMHATDPIFLKCLLKLILYLTEEFGARFAVLESVVANYRVLPRDTALRYLNACAEDAGPLKSEHGLSEPMRTGIQRIVSDVLAAGSVKDELKFLVRMDIPLDGLLSREELTRSQFSDAFSYESMLSLFRSKTADSSAVPQAPPVSIVDAVVHHEPAAVQKPQQEHSPSAAKLEQLGKENEELRRAVKALEQKLVDAETKLASMPPEKPDTNGEAEKISAESLSKLSIDKQQEREELQPKPAKKPLNPFKLGTKPAGASAAAADQKIGEKLGSAPVKPKLNLFGMKKKTVSKFAGKNYTGLKWNKTSKTADSVFERIDPFEAEKEFEVADFVCFEKTAAQPVPAPKHEAGVQRQPQQPACWDIKKSNALNIALGRVKASNGELLAQLLDGSLQNENLVNQFIMYFPTHDEFDMIKAASGPLGRAEKFFLLASDVTGAPGCFPSNVYAALHSIRFNALLRSRAYGEILAVLRGRYQRVIDSKELVRLFAALLAVGNALNVNTFNGNASAFSLDSLENFKTGEILRLVSKRVAKARLLQELVAPDEPEVPPVEEIKRELSELKNAYNEDYVSKEVAAEFLAVMEHFNQMIAAYNRARAYFNESDDSFYHKILDFASRLD
ncbi:hypothetical protein PAPHI01_1289 [Pancytospora philotis]|nr:hypothetical protein PAPHI01_1289 [Pancytospora philotis]